MSLDVNKLEDLSEANDWLRCPMCGSYDSHVEQDPDHIYFFCEECDNYTDFEIATWS